MEVIWLILGLQIASFICLVGMMFLFWIQINWKYGDEVLQKQHVIQGKNMGEGDAFYEATKQREQLQREWENLMAYDGRRQNVHEEES